MEGDQLLEVTTYGKELIATGTYLLTHLAERTWGSYSINGGLIARPTRLGLRSGEPPHGVRTAENPDLTHTKEVPQKHDNAPSGGYLCSSELLNTNRQQHSDDRLAVDQH